MIKFIKIATAALLAIGISSCEKDPLMENHNESKGTPSYRTSGGIQSMVSYNTEHDVLVFNSLEDVYRLKEYLSNQNPYDRENSSQIDQMLNDVAQNGFTVNNQGAQNKVKLSDLQLLLENSHPLSEASLQKLISVHQQVNFPVPFLKSILIANTPFSYETREQISLTANLPNADRLQILDADEDDLDKMDYVYEDFLNLFPGYHSLYEQQMNREVMALQSGMSPADETFDHAIFPSDYQQLIRNEKFELYINQEGLLKAYRNCMEILFPLPLLDAYSELQLLDLNGNVTIPTLSEGPQGISMTTINQSIPTDFITFNPEEYDPFIDDKPDPYYGTALQVLNIEDLCPKSNYTVNFDTATFLTATFNNITYYPSNPTPSITFQYWNFGDGTGSFLSNPVHTYATQGAYTATLTTFSTDCGCFHQHKVQLYAGPMQTRAGNPDCEIFLNLSVLKDFPSAGTDKFRLDIDGAGSFASITYEIVQKYADGTLSSPLSSGTAILGINYIDPPSGADGVYQIHVSTTRNSGCESNAVTETVFYSETQASPACCSRKEVVEDEETVTLTNGNEYLVKYDDLARGKFYKTVGGTIKAYKINSKGKPKKIKADHAVQIVGFVNGINDKDECTDETLDMGLTESDKTKNFNFESFQVWEYNRPIFGIQTPINYHHYLSYGNDVIWNDRIFTLNCN